MEAPDAITVDDSSDDEVTFIEHKMPANGRKNPEVFEVQDSSDVEILSYVSSVNRKAHTKGTGPRKRQSLNSPSKNLESIPKAGPSSAAKKKQSSVQGLAEVNHVVDTGKDAEFARRLPEKVNMKLMRQRDRRLEKASRTIENLVYAVTVDMDRNTLDGEPADPDNVAHLELVKKECVGVDIKKVTFFVNHALERRFANAKKALERVGHDATERMLFHGTAAKNVPYILEARIYREAQVHSIDPNNFDQDGFKIGGLGVARVNGKQATFLLCTCLTVHSSEGVGICLGASPMMSQGYSMGHNRIFAC